MLTPLVNRNVGIPELMALARMVWFNAVGSASPPAWSDWLVLVFEELLALLTPLSSLDDTMVGKGTVTVGTVARTFERACRTKEKSAAATACGCYFCSV